MKPRCHYFAITAPVFQQAVTLRGQNLSSMPQRYLPNLRCEGLCVSLSCMATGKCVCVCRGVDFALVPLFPVPPLLLLPLPHFASPPIILILHWRAVSEPWMHYAVCSIVCAVSLCLCPTLSQYLFSLITMGACCGCLDGFFFFFGPSFVP